MMENLSLAERLAQRGMSCALNTSQPAAKPESSCDRVPLQLIEQINGQSVSPAPAPKRRKGRLKKLSQQQQEKQPTNGRDPLDTAFEDQYAPKDPLDAAFEQQYSHIDTTPTHDPLDAAFEQQYANITASLTQSLQHMTVTEQVVPINDRATDCAHVLLRPSLVAELREGFLHGLRTGTETGGAMLAEYNDLTDQFEMVRTEQRCYRGSDSSIVASDHFGFTWHSHPILLEHGCVVNVAAIPSHTGAVSLGDSVMYLY